MLRAANSKPLGRNSVGKTHVAIEELITPLLTTVLVSITGYYAGVTDKTLKIMQQQSEAITRPYLTINVFAEPHGVLYYLRIANTGRTGASNVPLTLDRDFYQLGQKHMPNLLERQYSSSRSSGCVATLAAGGW